MLGVYRHLFQFDVAWGATTDLPWAIWGCTKTWYLFRWSKITWSWFFFTLIVFSGGELPVDKKCEFSSFLWVWKHPWSRVNGCNLLFSFPSIAFHFELLSCSFHFAFISFHVALISFHFAFMSFHVPSLCIEDTSPRKLTCSNRSGGYPPKRSRFCFIFRYRSLWSFSYRFGGLCRLPFSGFMNMYMYKIISSLSFFTRIVFWAGNALAVLRCKPSSNEMPEVINIPYNYYHHFL